mgnify:CR=1 FL=1
MFKSTFLHFSDGHLIAIGFILFMLTFLGAFFWTIIIQKKSFYTQMSQLPLQEGDEHAK